MMRIVLQTAVLLLFTTSQITALAPGDISSFAGSGAKGFGGDGGSAVRAMLNFPESVSVDRTGNIFIADSANNRIRKVDASTGVISTVAGNGRAGFSGDGGPAASASLSSPEGVAVDQAGNIFIADSDNSRIRRVDSAAGTITTVAGTGEFRFFGDSGPAANAALNSPLSVEVDASGNLYISDTFNNRIRRVDAGGIITTIAGDGSLSFGGDGGPAIKASLSLPEGLAFDSSGNLYIADTFNSRIRRVDASTGIITTVAGNGSESFSGDGGPAVNAAVQLPEGVSVDANGNIYIADTENCRIRLIDAVSKNISTIAGNGSPGFSGDGGSAASARVNFPEDVTIDSSGNIFIADTENHLIRKIETRTSQPPPSDFSLNVSPQTLNASPGSPASYTIDIQAVNGFSKQVSLSASINPAGNRIDIIVSPSTVTPSGTSSMTANVAAETQSGTYTITVTGRAGDIARTRTVTLVVNTSPNAAPKIVSANYRKPLLSVSGSGFGSSGIQVNINGKDVSGQVTGQSDTAISLKGNKKKLNVKKGANLIFVTSGGVASNTFMFDF